MTDRDIIQKLQTLRTTKPNSEWAISARKNLINHLEMDADSSKGGLLHTFSYAKVSAGFAFVAVMLMITSTIVAQSSLPGSLLYGVKIAFEGASTVIVPGEGLEVTFVERRVDEVSRLAVSKLEVEEADIVLQKMDGYRKEIEEAKAIEGDSDKINEKVATIKKEARVLTAAINKTDSGTFVDSLRALIVERMETCTDEGIAADVGELLENGDIASLIEANELSARCEE